MHLMELPFKLGAAMILEGIENGTALILSLL